VTAKSERRELRQDEELGSDSATASGAPFRGAGPRFRLDCGPPARIPGRDRRPPVARTAPARPGWPSACGPGGAGTRVANALSAPGADDAALGLALGAGAVGGLALERHLGPGAGGGVAGATAVARLGLLLASAHARAEHAAGLAAATGLLALALAADGRAALRAAPGLSRPRRPPDRRARPRGGRSTRRGPRGRPRPA